MHAPQERFWKMSSAPQSVLQSWIGFQLFELALWSQLVSLPSPLYACTSKKVLEDVVSSAISFAELNWFPALNEQFGNKTIISILIYVCVVWTIYWALDRSEWLIVMIILELFYIHYVYQKHAKSNESWVILICQVSWHFVRLAAPSALPTSLKPAANKPLNQRVHNLYTRPTFIFIWAFSSLSKWAPFFSILADKPDAPETVEKFDRACTINDVSEGCHSGLTACWLSDTECWLSHAISGIQFTLLQTLELMHSHLKQRIFQIVVNTPHTACTHTRQLDTNSNSHRTWDTECD